MNEWWEDLVDEALCPILHDSSDAALACATDFVETLELGETIWVRRAIQVRMVDMEDGLVQRGAIWPPERATPR